MASKPPSRKSSLIPLLHVLKSLKSADRVIILAHLDDHTRDAIYKTVSNVLKSKRVPIQNRIHLRDNLGSFKSDFRCLISKDSSSVQKKKKLTQLGGNPLSLILDTALPLMLDLFPK